MSIHMIYDISTTPLRRLQHSIGGGDKVFLLVHFNSRGMRGEPDTALPNYGATIKSTKKFLSKQSMPIFALTEWLFVDKTKLSLRKPLKGNDLIIVPTYPKYPVPLWNEPMGPGKWALYEQKSREVISDREFMRTANSLDILERIGIDVQKLYRLFNLFADIGIKKITLGGELCSVGITNQDVPLGGCVGNLFNLLKAKTNFDVTLAKSATIRMLTPG